jgi:hypothetical protein
VLSQEQAELNQYMVFSVSCGDSVQVRFKLGTCPGDSHALDIYIVGPCRQPTRCTYMTCHIPSGNVGKYILYYITQSLTQLTQTRAYHWSRGPYLMNGCVKLILFENKGVSYS